MAETSSSNSSIAEQDPKRKELRILDIPIHVFI